MRTECAFHIIYADNKSAVILLRSVTSRPNDLLDNWPVFIGQGHFLVCDLDYKKEGAGSNLLPK